MAIFGRNKDKSKGSGLGRSTTTDSSLDETSRPIDDAADLSFEPEEDFESADGFSIENDVDVAVEDQLEEGFEPKKRGFFGRRKSKELKTAKPSKEKKAKKVKPLSSKEERRKEKELEEEKELSTRLSILVEIEELPGVTKEDAIETARHQALNHSERPSNCFYNVLQTRNGFLIEVQEGVGRSYLPSVYKLAMDHPNRIIVVPMVRRNMTIIYSPRTDTFDTQILAEDVEPPVINGEKPLYAKRGPAMTPVFKQHQQWLTTGIFTAVIGGLSFIASMTFYFFDPDAKVPPEWRTTNVAQLPVMQWTKLAGGTSDSFVVRLEFTEGQWRVVRQSSNASVEVSDVQGDQSSAAIVGDNVVAPTTPDVSGAPGANPGSPQGAPGALPNNYPQPAGSAPEIAPPAGLTQ